jgi:hypothetical protein
VAAVALLFPQAVSKPSKSTQDRIRKYAFAPRTYELSKAALLELGAAGPLVHDALRTRVVGLGGFDRQVFGSSNFDGRQAYLNFAHEPVKASLLRNSVVLNMT